MKRVFHRHVGDALVKVELDTSLLEPDDDLFVEASRVAATMGLLADLMDEATVNLELAEGALRALRGQVAIELMDADGDISQWKVEKRSDADIRVVQGLSHVARAKGDLAFLKTYSDALRLQSSMVRARTELRRIERDAQPGFGGSDDDENDAPPVRRRSVTRDKGVQTMSEIDQLKAKDAAFRRKR